MAAKHPVTVELVHPLAESEADRLSGGDRARWRVKNTRCVLVVNYPGWKPRKSRKARA